MSRLLRRLFKRLFTVTGVVLIVLAIGVGGFRLLVTQLPSYQGEIQAWARDALGVTVNFTGLDARWGLLGPELTFHDASMSRVDDEANPIISAAEARIGLSALALFTQRRLEVNRLTLQGTRLSFERAMDGTLRLQHGPDSGDGDREFVLEELPPVVIVVSESTVVYEDRIRQRTWEFQDVRLELTRSADSVVVEARASAPETLGGRIEISAEASLLKDPNDGEREWRLFTEVRGLDLAVLSTLIPEPTKVAETGVGDVSIWLSLTGSKPQQGTLQLAFEDVRLREARSDDDPIYDNVELTAEWSRLEGGWALSFSNLDLSHGGRTWPSDGRVDIRVLRDEDGLSALTLSSDFLRLEDLTPLVAILPASDATSLWADLAPRGELDDLQLSLNRGSDGSWSYSAAALFDDLAVSSRGEWPGVTRLSGELRADSRSGRLALTTREAVLDWPTLFTEPLGVDELTGILVWRQGRDGLRLVSDDLVLNNRDARTRSSLELTIPMDGTSPVLELESSVFDFDIGSSSHYLPVGIMNAAVHRYLSQAIVGGRVPRADIAFFGPVTSFPFDAGEGQFDAHVQIENGTMDYVENWPRAESMSGTIDFLNAGWVANGYARVLGNSSDELRVGIADLRDPILTVAATTTGPLEDVFGFLESAPLIARHLGPDLARLEPEAGTGNVTIDLQLPLLDRSGYALSAELEIVDGAISVAGFGPSASEIQGVLTLDDDGLRAEGIEATLLEGPVMVGISLPDEPGYLADIAFDGEIDVDAIHNNFDLPFEGHLAGQTRWQGNLLLPKNTYTQVRREPLKISIGSNLSGVALRLPAPLQKSPDEPTSFQLDFVFSESDRLDVSGHIGAARRFALSFRNRDGALSFRRGSVRFGGDYPLLPPRDGLSLAGSLGRVDLDEWRVLFDDELSDASLAELLLGADVEIADLSVLGQHLGHTELSVRQEATQWRLEVESEPVAGIITMPLDVFARPQLVADMERLNITTGNGVGSAEGDPRDLPGLKIRAEQFAVGQRRFGELDADIQADPLGLRMVSFETSSESFAMEGSGGWFDGVLGPATRLALTLTSQDVATTLEQLGLDPITEGESGDVTLSVFWPGAPSADWTESISGDLTLRVERGSIVDLEPGAGRMMGLMSITALPRRLALDFRDVFNRGLVFDEVNGDFLIIDGNAYTDNLHLTGPVADIGVVGRTGLHAQDYQQQAVVTAEPGKILPTMGFLAGPQIGAALLLFTQIFKEPLKGIGRASYCVTGSWYEPTVERLTSAELEDYPLCADLLPGADGAQH